MIKAFNHVKFRLAFEGLGFVVDAVFFWLIDFVHIKPFWKTGENSLSVWVRVIEKWQPTYKEGERPELAAWQN